ncbi:hypothetical protein BDR03DRAFT_1090979 [Suillus americanus]|nr:hypothetical protein BDR03DRAFT_1090979 [Suillus americanus]
MLDFRLGKGMIFLGHVSSVTPVRMATHTPRVAFMVMHFPSGAVIFFATPVRVFLNF